MGEAEMRIDVGVAVTGEVLQRGERAAGVQAAHARGRELADAAGPPNDARVDDGVGGLLLTLASRREVHVDADRARLERRDARSFVREPLVTGRPNAIAAGTVRRRRESRRRPRSRRRSAAERRSAWSRFRVEAAASGWPSIDVL